MTRRVPNDAASALIGPIADRAYALSQVARPRLLEGGSLDVLYLHGASEALLVYVEAILDATSAMPGASVPVVIPQDMFHRVGVLSGRVEQRVVKFDPRDGGFGRDVHAAYGDLEFLNDMWKADVRRAEEANDRTRLDDDGGWILPANNT